MKAKHNRSPCRSARPSAVTLRALLVLSMAPAPAPCSVRGSCCCGPGLPRPSCTTDVQAQPSSVDTKARSPGGQGLRSGVTVWTVLRARGLGPLGGFPLVAWPKGPKACLSSVAPPTPRGPQGDRTWGRGMVSAHGSCIPFHGPCPSPVQGVRGDGEGLVPSPQEGASGVPEMKTQ